MTTQAWAFGIDHGSDAGFQAWVTDLTARFTAVGLTQTADTGQINPATATRPATNTNGGFQIWRFNDTAHGTAPIFLRIDYGTGSVANRTRLQLTVGTGSNGSGTITGSVLAATSTSATTGTQAGAVVISYLVYNASVGHLALVHGASAATSGLAASGFAIARTCDSDGTPNVTGAVILTHSTGANLTSDCRIFPVRFAATARNFNDISGAAFLASTNETESLVSGEPQNFLMFAPMPRITPMRQLCSAMTAELSFASTALMQTVGAGSNTFVNMDRQLGEVAAAVSSTIGTRFGLCVLWE